MVLKNSVKACLLFFVLLILSNCSDDDKGPKITAAEGLFINEIYASGDDWVELYNSTDDAKDISGYFIQDDGEAKYELPANTIVPANGYLVIFCDDTNTGLHTNFKLSSDGETVTLKNSENKIAESVTYPKLDNGQSYGRYPDGSDDFAISGVTSQGSTNNESDAPAITSIMRTPTVPGLASVVTVQAELSNTGNLSTVKLYYKFNDGAFTSVAMSLSGSYYTATIPAQNATGTVRYYVEAKSTTGAVTYKPFDAPDDSYKYLLNDDELPQLQINEIMASSVTCCPDIDSGVDEFDDWIEIHNYGPTAIDVGGMYLSDDITDPFKSKIPDDDSSSTTIPAGGFMIFWADEQGSQGTHHMNFKLSKGGEAVGLFYIDGRTIDSKTFGEQDDDKSFGRTANGATWQQFSNPTQGASNN